MNRKQVVVFGAAGFIGTYLIDELLKNNYEVLATDINEIGEAYYGKHNIPYISVDITKEEEFEKIKQEHFDIVIHLAALQPANFSPNGYKPIDYININVLGTANILDFAKQKGAQKIIYATSHRNTSGLWHKGTKIKEQDGRAQQYEGEYAMFSISESAAQDCVEFYNANCEINGVIFRLPPVYGYGPHLEIFKNGVPVKTGFQTFIDNAKQCKPLEVWGDITVGRDIIYVKDVVLAFLNAMKNENVRGLYNITSGYKLTLQEEVETIARVFWGDKTQPVLVYKPEKKHTMDSFVYDNIKAKQELDWEPHYSFEKMLIDYDKEVKSNRFAFLIEKRKKMFNG